MIAPTSRMRFSRLGKMNTQSVRRRISRLSRSWGLCDQICCQSFSGKSGKSGKSGTPECQLGRHQGARRRGKACRRDRAAAGRTERDGGAVGLVKNSVQHCRHRRPHALRCHPQQVRRDRVLEACVGIGGCQVHPRSQRWPFARRGRYRGRQESNPRPGGGEPGCSPQQQCSPCFSRAQHQCLSRGQCTTSVETPAVGLLALERIS